MAAGLLTVDGECFKNSPEASQFLVRGRPDYMGMRHHAFRRRWQTVLRAAESGGSGGVAIALAQAWPDLAATIIDLPATAAIAQRNVDKAGLAARITVLGADILRDSLGESYDAAVLRGVVVVLASEDARRLLSRVSDVLAPGGRDLCCRMDPRRFSRHAARAGDLQAPIRHGAGPRRRLYGRRDQRLAYRSALPGRRSSAVSSCLRRGFHRGAPWQDMKMGTVSKARR